MVAMLIGCLFALVAAFALTAMFATHRHHADAWSALAAERQALIERDRFRLNDVAEREIALASGRYPRTVSVRRPAEPTSAVMFQRRFSGRSEWTPLRSGQRAAA